MSQEKKTCATCAHTESMVPPGSVQRVIVCHGAPPSLLAHPQGIVSVFPQVDPDQWCAQWKPKELQLAGVTPMKSLIETGSKAT